MPLVPAPETESNIEFKDEFGATPDESSEESSVEDFKDAFEEASEDASREADDNFGIDEVMFTEEIMGQLGFFISSIKKSFISDVKDIDGSE